MTAHCPQCGRPSCEGLDCEEYQEFRELLEEGHSYAQAAVLSGWKGAEEV